MHLSPKTHPLVVLWYRHNSVLTFAERKGSPLKFCGSGIGAFAMKGIGDESPEPVCSTSTACYKIRMRIIEDRNIRSILHIIDDVSAIDLLLEIGQVLLSEMNYEIVKVDEDYMV